MCAVNPADLVRFHSPNTTMLHQVTLVSLLTLKLLVENFGVQYVRWKGRGGPPVPTRRLNNIKRPPM